ncbi:MAG: hypothetical protein ACRD2E_00805 [Terriglobales bacterium]
MSLKLRYLLLAAGVVLLALPGAAQSSPQRHLPPSQVACANFFSPHGYRSVLRIIGARGGTEVSMFTTGDILYLNHAGRFQPGDQLRLMRVVTPGQDQEQFPGQSSVLHRMGTFFEVVGRARVLRVDQNQVALARMTFSCQPARVGDFAIAWRPNPNPTLPRVANVNWIAPVRGTSQLVAMGRDMAGNLGRGDEMYLTGGAAVGAHVGQVWTIFRRHDSPSNWQFKTESEGMTASSNHPESGVNTAALRSLPQPADVLGRAVIIRVEPRSATAVITVSRAPILVGDQAVPTGR